MYFHLTGTNVRVMGSLHKFPVMIPPASVPPWAQAAEHWSETIIIEADASTFLPICKMPEADLKTILPPDVWDALIEIWPTSGPLFPLNGFQLWATALLAGVLSIKSGPGMENYLHDAAQRKGKAIGFLETATNFAAIAETVPADDIISAIRIGLSNRHTAQCDLEEMFAHWRIGDLNGLDQQLLKLPALSVETMRQAILVKRNQSWVPIIKLLLPSSKRTLIAVGAMHLCGPDNLLDCLGLPYQAVD